MPNQELIEYIKKEQQKGLENTVITSSLLTVGWQQSQIDEAFSCISPQPPLPKQQSIVDGKSYNQTVYSSSKTPKIISSNENKRFSLIGTIIILILIFLLISATILFAYGKLPIKNYDLQNKIANILMSIPFMPKASLISSETSN
jgi:hypothetical protein